MVRDKSGHAKDASERVPLTIWRSHAKGQVWTRNECDQQGALTYWRPHRKGQVRTWIECNRESGTHGLKTASGGTCQAMDRMQPREWHSQPEDRTGRDKSGHRKNGIEQGALTN